ncbi:MAG: choline dehydrogenase [Rhodospirillaceae bacterium]|nr:choline dehydrogenase [Rhodospirillaceae bacterium]
MTGETFDYVIVGGGTAGCVLANRLSADPALSVLLLEAGPSDRHWHVQMPMGNVEALKGNRFNWDFMTVPEPHLDGRRMSCPRGRVLGGSSSINGMVHVRGHKRDFDDWSDSGCSGWSYEELLPYFRRSETYGGQISSYRGAEGPLEIAPGQDKSPLNLAFLTAGAEAGLAENSDFNGARQDGVGTYDLAIKDGRRVNGVRAYLDPVRERSNLTILTGARAQRILFNGHRATGVAYRHRDADRTCRAGREVIVSAGSIHSPQLLMLSGVGDAAHLEDHGIASRHHLPAVGAGLQNHIDIYMQYHCSKPVTLNGKAGPLGRLMIGAEWFLNKSGVCASNGFEVGAFLTALDDSDRPDTQIIFFPVAFEPGSFDVRPWHGYQFHVGTQKPEGRGWVRLASADPAKPPLIHFNFLATERDRRHIRAAMRRVRDIAHAPGFDTYRGREAFPGDSVKTDSEIDEWLAAFADTAYHPCCTCRMGSPDEPQAVVDPACRVIGLDALRIVDASVMPTLVNSNPNASVVAIAEKAADMILDKSPLAIDEQATHGQNTSGSAQS